MSDDVYRKLRALLDTYAIGFPASASGVEIELLKTLFTPEEAEVSLHLTMVPEFVEAVAARMGRDPEDLIPILEGMVRKGTIFKSQSPEGKTCYHATPYMHGLAENLAGNLNVAMAKLFDQYEEEAYLDHFLTLPLANVVRFIPIGGNPGIRFERAPAQQGGRHSSLKEEDRRHSVFLSGQGKGAWPQLRQAIADACFMFDWIADYSVARGHARYLDLSEALEIQHRFEEAGLVSMPSNFKDPMAMCHCCGDCCITIRALKKANNPSDYITCDFYAQVDDSVCTGCENCIEYCPMDAIAKKDADETIRIDLNRCIGCGNCISKCPVEALKIHEKPDEQKKKGPVDVMEFVQEMSKVRGMKANPFFS